MLRTLRGADPAVFFKCAVVSGAAEEARHARRHHRARGGGRERCAVGGRRDAVGALEAGRERADALQPDGEAHVGDRAVGGSQQRRGPLHAPREQIGVRRLAECRPELAAEVRPREAGRLRHLLDPDRLAITGVCEVLRSEQVACWWDELHLMTAMVSPVATEPPSETPSSSTVPALGAVISFSIFMASITQMRAPSSTSAPFSTATLRTVPWIGETSSPGAPPPPPVFFSRRGACLAPAAGPAPFAASASPITVTSKRRPDTSTA